jgi:hypothetical protein
MIESREELDWKVSDKLHTVVDAIFLVHLCISASQYTSATTPKLHHRRWVFHLLASSNSLAVVWQRASLYAETVNARMAKMAITTKMISILSFGLWLCGFPGRHRELETSKDLVGNCFGLLRKAPVPKQL